MYLGAASALAELSRGGQRKAHRTGDLLPTSVPSSATNCHSKGTILLPGLVRAAFHPKCLDSVYGLKPSCIETPPPKPEIGKRNGTGAFQELWRLLAAAQEWLREHFQLLSSCWLSSHCPQSLCPHLHPDPPTSLAASLTLTTSFSSSVPFHSLETLFFPPYSQPKTTLSS